MVKAKTKAKPEASTSLPQASLEANRKLAYKLIAEGYSDHDIAEATKLTDKAIWGLRGVLKKAEKRQAEANKPAEILEQKPLESQKSLGDGEGVGLPHASATPQRFIESTPSPHVIASPGVILDNQAITNLRSMMSKPQQKVFDAQITVAEQRQTQTLRNDGHAQPRRYVQEDNPYIRRLEKLAEARDFKKLMGLDKESNTSVKDFISLIQLGMDMARPKSSGPNPLELYRIGRLDEAKVQGQISSAQGPSPANQWSLQVEDMKGRRQLDNKKLDWEISKYSEEKKDSRESTGQMYGMVKDVLKGPIGETIRVIGGSAAEKLRPKPQGEPQPKLVTAQCPKCGGKFLANPELPQIMCSQCGSVLTKTAPSQPQESLIREVPQQPTIKEIPQEIKKIESKPKPTEVND